MKCQTCSGSCVISEIAGGAVRFCPLCGSALAEEKKQIDSIPACFSYIMAEFGREKLNDSKYVMALVADLLPSLTVEKRILKVALDSGVYKEFLIRGADPSDLLIRRKKAEKHLVDEYGLSDTWAENALRWMLESIYGAGFEEKTTAEPAIRAAQPGSPHTISGEIGSTAPDSTSKQTASVSAASGIAQCRKGSRVQFGSYPQSVDGGLLPIEWIVLEKESDRALLLSLYGLECRGYHDKGERCTWETCALRRWLNDDFFHHAFSSPERNHIENTQITAETTANPKFSSAFNNGRTVYDSVFLLSVTEVKQYLPTLQDRKCSSTDYAIRKLEKERARFWWLRSPGFDSEYAADVLESGILYYAGDSVNGDYGMVRPAIWVRTDW